MLRFARLTDRVSDWIGQVFCFYLIALTLVLVYEVISRYALNNPTIWAHEISGIMFTVFSAFGGSYCLRHKAHVNVDIIYARFSPRGRAIIDLITTPAVGLMCWVLVWFGWQGAVESIGYRETSNTMWAPPLYHAKVLIAVAIVLFTLQVLAKLIHDIHTAVTGGNQHA